MLMKRPARKARAAHFVLLAFSNDKYGGNHMGKAIGSSFSLGGARAPALRESIAVISGIAAAAMFSGSLYSSSAAGGTGSQELGYYDHDSARAFSAVSALRNPLQNSEPDPGAIALTSKDRPAQIDYSGNSITVFPGVRMDFKNYQASEDRPQEESSVVRLIKDGWRAVTSFIRGNPVDEPNPPAATIGVRGSAGKTWECTKGPQCMWQSMLYRR